jgi:DNA-binding NarL/FixJ family response regulator
VLVENFDILAPFKAGKEKAMNDKKKKSISVLWRDVIKSVKDDTIKKTLSNDSPKKINSKENKQRYAFSKDEQEIIYFTPREIDATLLLQKNYTVKEIAEELKLSARTVEFYVKNIRTKLKCTSKAEVVKFVSHPDFLKKLNRIE